MMAQPQDLRRLAVDIARGAGDILLKMHAQVEGTKSSPTDLVTDADRASERYIVDRIREERPGDAILGEEGTKQDGTSGITWVIDPLDGTVNYVYEIPQWCVSIGVEGELRLGVVHDPRRDETFTDNGWIRQGVATDLRPSPKTDLASSLIGTGFSYSSAIRTMQADVLRRVLPKVRDVRRAGSCALDLSWVACGRLDAFYEHDTHHWDISAGIAILEAAGGCVMTRGDLTIGAGNQELLDAIASLVL